MSFPERLIQLKSFLDAEDLHDEALDYIAAHGYLTALSICPAAISETQWIAELFAEQPIYANSQEQEDIEQTLVQLKAYISRKLASDDEFELPCDLDLGDDADSADIRGWCIGFMEGVFLNEEDWFNEEETVSELLLPIMLISGLFDEQEEFIEMVQDEELIENMLSQLPELITALFLLCQSPEEKPALLKS